MATHHETPTPSDEPMRASVLIQTQSGACNPHPPVKTDGTGGLTSVTEMKTT